MVEKEELQQQFELEMTTEMQCQLLVEFFSCFETLGGGNDDGEEEGK